MNEEYNTPTRQTDVKHRVAGLRVSTFVAAGQTEKEALETVRTMIDQLSPQLAPLNRADENLVDYLRGAVVGEPWADSVVSRIATTKPSFQQLFLELDAALGLKEEGRAAVAKDVPINSQVAATKAALPVMYAGQGVYAYANRGVGATTPRSRATVGAPIPASRPSATRATTTTRPRFDPLSVAGCFNCDNPGHTMRQCPIPVDTFKAAQRKLAYYDKKHAGGRGGAATVLYLMCRQSGQHPTTYLFGGVLTPCTGTVVIRVPIAPAHYVAMRVAIVDLSIPFLFGLDALDAFSLYVNNVDNSLKCDARGFKTPLTRKDGHLYLVWNNAIHYTTTELDRLHRHFHHPQTGRLAELLRRAGGAKITPDVQAELAKVAAACDVCQRLAVAPHRFRTTMPSDDLSFNRTVYLDLMYLEGKSVLHVVDRDTAFSAAAFTDGERVDVLWQLYCCIWANPYVGHPSFMHADQGPQFKSAAWKALTNSAGVDLQLSGVESHNALGTGERYHAFLRTIYRRVRMEHPTVTAGSALSMAVAAMNQTAGPRGLVPTLLVFGVLPRTPITPLPLPVQRERMEAMATARKEMAAQVAKARVAAALTSSVPAATGRVLKSGEQVLVYREPPVHEWFGPHTVIAQQDKVVWLAIDGHLRQFAVDKVKPYLTSTPAHADEETKTPTPLGAAVPASATTPTKQPASLTATMSQPIRAPSPPPTGDNPDFGRHLDSTITGEALLAAVHRTVPAVVGLNKVIPASDPRVATTQFRDAALKEVAGLRDRGAFSVVNAADVPPEASVIGGRFVYTLNHVGAPEEMAKARFVAQGHRDKAKWFVVHNLATLRQRSTRLLVSTAAIMRWRIFAHDITQAYLQSRDAFSRCLYLRPHPGDRHLFDISETEVLKLDLPPNDLGMMPLTSDPALYVKWQPEHTLSGLLGAYVDDCLMGGDDAFAALTQRTLTRFQGKPRMLDNAEFVGVHITTVASGVPHFAIDQRAYVDNLERLPLDASFTMFLSARARVAWLTHTRPDLCCGINLAAQVTEATYSVTACRRVVHSIMAGEVYAFSAAFDEAFVIRYDLERLYRRRIPLNMFTDSKQLFDVVTKASHPTEKRLLVDIAAARQAYNRQDLSNVGLVASENNIADALRKARGCGALDALLRTGVDRTPVVQWVIRPTLDPPCATTGKPAV
ncbi:hypothetical protein BU14_0183s0011 [Porphyra umbilicalis]|uniref:CCHC-type domain-containing protein n=1 Tax=Porphyra umbilicalis TaxID=2786 RepID=A0A1X6P6V7_PORUM|nr:hypothetical protein BU14_0183s0011 [Porphyra umbilicalis]|eukprot:OSX76619.1 hypothetical protein BU14_0183s0011 [Porphyra umbilicalis]